MKQKRYNLIEPAYSQPTRSIHCASKKKKQQKVKQHEQRQKPQAETRQQPRGRNVPSHSTNKPTPTVLEELHRQPDPAHATLLPLPAHDTDAESEMDDVVDEVPAEWTNMLQSDDDDDEEMDVFEQRWFEFSELDSFDGHVALFLQTIQDKHMDSDYAFEMLATIYDESIDHNERDRYDHVVEMLREHMGDMYEDNAPYYLQNRICNALVLKRYESLPALLDELIALAEDSLETFFDVVDHLAYHGQTRLVAKALHESWNTIRDSADIADINERSIATVFALLHDYLEQTVQPDANDPSLRVRLESVAEVSPERLTRYIALVTGQATPSWTNDHFILSDEVEQNLYDVSIEFLGYIQRNERVPYVKGEMARRELVQYFIKRRKGDIVPGENFFGGMLKSAKARAKDAAIVYDHVLCPDYATFDTYSASMLDIFSSRHYQLTALLELTPSWLRFLESLQLIDANQQTKTLSELRKIIVESLNLWYNSADPTTHEAMQRVWNLDATEYQME